MTNLPDDEKDARRLDAQLLSDLWIFRAAARFGSITTAASRLGVTQSAVSQRVLRLEARLGVALFMRQKSRITLTEAGKSLFDAMTKVTSVLNDGLSRVYRMQHRAIVVSCVPSLATEWLVPHLGEFYSQNPDIEVFVRSEFTASTPERMEDEAIDLIIDYKPAASAGLHVLATIRELLFPVCSRRYRQVLDWPDSPSSPIVLLRDVAPWWGGSGDDEWTMWREAAEVSADWPGRPTTDRHFNLALLAYHAAMCDQGIAVGRSVIVNRLLSKGELITAAESPPVPGLSYWIMTNRPGNAGSPVQRFAKWWEEAMTETQSHTLSLLAAETQEPD